MSPLEQAQRYIPKQAYSQRSRYIVLCNFDLFLIYDQEKTGCEPEMIQLENLLHKIDKLYFLVEKEEKNTLLGLGASQKAWEIVRELYDEILKCYKTPDAPEVLKALNILCVRLVFCLYADASGVFPKQGQFREYLCEGDLKYLRTQLLDLFRVLDTSENNRDPYLVPELAEFPYVNGDCFLVGVEIPMLNARIKELLTTPPSDGFHWSDISPTVFGAMFESTWYIASIY